MKTNFKKIAVIAGALAVSFFAACKKDQSTAGNENPMPAPVSYTITDRMQVNNEDGKPRPLGALQAINGETVAFSSEALNGGPLVLNNSAGGSVMLNVAGNTGGNLTLAQNYPAADGFASGTVYYALSRN